MRSGDVAESRALTTIERRAHKMFDVVASVEGAPGRLGPIAISSAVAPARTRTNSHDRFSRSRSVSSRSEPFFWSGPCVRHFL
jgi:hypothetical protein